MQAVRGGHEKSPPHDGADLDTMNNKNEPAENSAVATLIQQRERKAWWNGFAAGTAFGAVFCLVAVLIPILRR